MPKTKNVFTTFILKGTFPSNKPYSERKSRPTVKISKYATNKEQECEKQREKSDLGKIVDRVKTQHENDSSKDKASKNS